jgi:hypothetical protein
VVPKTILIIGRKRTGKSTLKNLLVNPTIVPDQMTIESCTRDATFETFGIEENGLSLNIIDTSGLCEHGTEEFSERDNAIIRNTIEQCMNREITQFHLLCFCISLTTGITNSDIQLLRLLTEQFGNDVTKNLCLIFTHCESKTKDQCDEMLRQLSNDQNYQIAASFFQRGIHFSGALDPDAWESVQKESLFAQFVRISEYRTELIEFFTNDIQPFNMSQTQINNLPRPHENRQVTEAHLDRSEIPIVDHHETPRSEIAAVETRPESHNNEPRTRELEQEVARQNGIIREQAELIEQLRLVQIASQSRGVSYEESDAMSAVLQFQHYESVIQKLQQENAQQSVTLRTQAEQIEQLQTARTTRELSGIPDDDSNAVSTALHFQHYESVIHQLQQENAQQIVAIGEQADLIEQIQAVQTVPETDAVTTALQFQQYESRIQELQQEITRQSVTIREQAELIQQLQTAGTNRQ